MDVSTADVLAQCSNEDLAPLIKYILEASTESLSSHELYKSHAPDHHQYEAQILQEIRLFGGNSFVNLFRKEGPEYFEVVQDVASKFGVPKASKFTSVTALEEELIQKILRDALKKADGQAREDMEAQGGRLRSGGPERAVIGIFIGHPTGRQGSELSDLRVVQHNRRSGGQTVTRSGCQSRGRRCIRQGNSSIGGSNWLGHHRRMDCD
jgi:hypothetical protein